MNHGSLTFLSSVDTFENKHFPDHVWQNRICSSFVYFLKNEALYAARLLRTPPKRKISIDQGGQVIETNPIAANEQLQPAKKTPRTVQLVTVSRKQSVPKKVTTKKNSSRNLRLCRRFGSDRKPQLLIIRDRFFSVGCKFYSNKNYGKNFYGITALHYKNKF